MKQYIVSLICRETGEKSIEFYNEDELNRFHITKYDIPKRLNCSKTVTRQDTFANLVWFTTITRVK